MTKTKAAKAPAEPRPCPVYCGRTAKPGHALCYPCWQQVPHPLQQAVYRTWKAWTDSSAALDVEAFRAYQEALAAAVDAV